MTTWSQTQQLKYFAGFVLALILLIGVPAYIILNDAPTCSDGLQNGTEQGIDCGGICEAICSFQTQPAKIAWSRSFKVVDGVYNIVALIENPNVGAEAFRVPYIFKVRDADNILIAERKGRLYVPPQSIVPVFEASVQTGNGIPGRTTFEFGGEIEWKDAPQRENVFRIESRQIDETVTDTRLTTRITNTSLDAISDVEVVAVLIGADGNARAVSQTVIDRMKGGETATLVFTWPGTFKDDIVRSDLYPVVVPR